MCWRCGGSAELDECGECNGPGLNDDGCCGDITADCAGVCGGSAELDECGVCDGSGIADGACDCDGTLPETCWDGTSTCNDDCAELPANYPLDWDANFDGVLDTYNQYANNGSVTGIVLSDEGVVLSSEGDMIAAFVGSEQRGVARAAEGPGFSSYDYVFLMMCYSDESSGEVLTFKYYSASDDAVYDVATTLDWEADMVVGNAVAPFEFQLASDISEIVVPLGTGWNWISINVEGENMNVNSVFSQFTEPDWQCDYGGSNTDCPYYIKSQSAFGIYYSGFGFYPEFNMSVQGMYKLQMNAPSELHFEGMPAAPDTEFPLNPGWNWIGYIPTTSMGANTALSSIILNNTPSYIKSQSGFGIFYEDFGFYPEISMEPFGGYQLQMNSEDVLVYPDGMLSSVSSSFDNEQVVDASKYEFNGSITAYVDIPNVEIDNNDILFAYHNKELRGQANPDIFPLTGEYVFSLMVYGNNVENENLNFVFYDYQNDTMYDLGQNIKFESDMILGNAINPQVLDYFDNSIASEFEIISVYPNPFNPTTNISYYINENANVEVSLFDLTGRRVETLENSFKQAGEYTVSWDASNHSSGIYYLQISNGELVRTQKLTLIK